MCGIAGIFYHEKTLETDLLNGMIQGLQHRGPDGIGRYLDSHMGLAHARLSIIDLAGGDQPLISSDGQLILVANGEIYNYPELRAELELLGAVFATHSDCETILYAYRYFGDDFVSKLHGMFAFALYDRVRQRLLLARDRLGIKPLFILENEAGICFASEQKALLPLLNASARFSNGAVNQILYASFSTGDQSLVEGITRMPSGELWICERGLDIKKTIYWTPLTSKSVVCAFDDAARRFDELMQAIMREHVRSDVPFALFLSGGIDSSVLLEYLRREGVQNLAAFTVAFNQAQNNDDLAAAKQLAEKYQLDHRIITLDQTTLFEHLPFAVWAVDDLILDPAILPTSLLAREVAKEYKVVFSGEGGDELFAGYGRYRRSRLQRFLAQLRAPGSGGFRTRGLIDNPTARSLFTPAFNYSSMQGRSGFVAAWQQTPDRWSDLQRMQYVDLVSELEDKFLVKLDRTLMAWGLEGRVPFLDHSMVEFGLGLPDALKVHGRIGKYFLKRWAEPLFGGDFVYRPKSGFTVPIAGFLAGQNLKRLLRVLPQHPGLCGVFQPEQVERLIRRQGDQGDVSVMLLAVLQLAIWFQIFVLNAGKKPDVFCDPISFIEGYR